jgi:hypothetical protein
MITAGAFKVTKNWGDWPEAWGHAEVTSVAVDRHDNVYAFVRGPHPIVVFSPNGAVESTWGEGEFVHPHAISIAPDGTVYCTDDFQQTVRHYSAEGELLGVLNRTGEPSFYEGVDPDLAWTIKRPGPPFNYPTDAVATSEGKVYVTDGYGNARVHVFGADGHLERSWGEPGSGPGQFTIPHGIKIGPDGRVYVADRVNSRIQIFGAEGDYLDEWPARLPNNLCFDRAGNPYVAELGATVVLSDQPSLRWPPARITLRDPAGRILTALVEDDPTGADMYYAPHGIAVDSAGAIYAAEVPFSYSRRTAPKEVSVLRKFERS